MKTIQLDEQVYEMVLKLAIPYTDRDENDTLRRTLKKLLDDGMATSSGSAPPSPGGGVNGRARSSRRASNGAYTSQKVYWRPILEIIDELGGRAPIGEVLEHIPDRVTLTTEDHEKTNSGWILWQNRACWARQNMKDQGLLRGDSPRGVWEISDEGHRALAENRV